MGLNAGAPPGKIEEARVLGRKEIGRSGGQKHQENRHRRAKEWQAFAAAEFRRLRQKPNITLSSAANVIAKNWEPAFETITLVDMCLCDMFPGD